MVAYLIAGLVLIILSGFYLGQTRAQKLQASQRLHSLPLYHGYHVALWCAIPSVIIVLLWFTLEPIVIQSAIRSDLSGKLTGVSESEAMMMMTEVKNISQGIKGLSTEDPQIIKAGEAMASLNDASRTSMLVIILAIAIGITLYARSMITPEFGARYSVEYIFNGFLFFSSTIAILTTIGIVLSLFYESLLFFEQVPVTDFLFGLKWYPQIAIREDQAATAGAFGAVPVFAGTFLIAFIAMVIAGPIGLFSAIYFSEYSSHHTRTIVKPILEILAGIPTVVYGFFAALTVAPLVRDLGVSLGFEVEARSALAAGVVMGIMIIPFVSSLSDDVINSVPQSLRDGSLAIGATQSETIKRVIIPAALPGIVGAFLLALSRAVGETMIVAMAAGLNANLTANPLENVTTVTVQIVVALIGDQEFDDPKTLSAFALGLVLFFVTLILNVIALSIVKRYREKYE